MLKKVMSSILAVAMLASMGSTVFASESPVVQNQDTSINSKVSPKWYRSYINQNYVRFRTGPGAEYTALGQLQYNDTVDPTFEYATDSTGIEWTEVYSERHQKTGWVASQYISNEGM